MGCFDQTRPNFQAYNPMEADNSANRNLATENKSQDRKVDPNQTTPISQSKMDRSTNCEFSPNVDGNRITEVHPA